MSVKKILNQTVTTIKNFIPQSDTIKKWGATAILGGSIALAMSQTTPDTVRFSRSRFGVNKAEAGTILDTLKIALGKNVQGYRVSDESEKYRDDATYMYKILAVANFISGDANPSDEEVRAQVRIYKIVSGEAVMLVYQYPDQGQLIRISSSTKEEKDCDFYCDQNGIIYAINVGTAIGARDIAVYVQTITAQIDSGAISWNPIEAEKLNQPANLEVKWMETRKLFEPSALANEKSTGIKQKRLALKSTVETIDRLMEKDLVLWSQDPIDKEAIRSNNKAIKLFFEKMEILENEIRDSQNPEAKN
jgi:hypothetical protein